MPVKRRAAKARRQIDDMDLQELFYGPGSCLINCTGYLGPYGDGKFADKSEAIQAEVLDTMRADWERHCEAVMDAWRARTPHDLYIDRTYHGDPAEPWALQQFGVPDNAH